MKIKILLVLLIIGFTFSGCKREFGDYYNPPPGQQTDIYKQLAGDSSLSIFVAAIDKVPGLKAELSSSGLFTVMAPDNAAFKKFFATSQYSSLDVIPLDKLELLVKFHILKWMLFQDNFINPGLNKTNPEIYKYETRATFVYKAKLSTGKTIPIFYPSKMSQVYTPTFFNYYGVTPQDYSEVFGFSSVINSQTMMNVLSASVTSLDVASGNGVYYKIDKVLEPLLNIAQELDSNPEYSDYIDLYNKRFLTYTYNDLATKAQGNNGDINGDGVVDSLFTRTYLTDKNLDNENPLGTDKKSISLSAFIPTKAAFNQYLNSKVLPNFGNSKDSIPDNLLLLLFKSHLTNNMDWPSRIDKGYAISILGDKMKVTRQDIRSVKMTSNGLLYEVNKVIEPTAFTAVTGPAFFAPQYWYFAEMLVRTNLIATLTVESVKYTILAPTNAAFNARGIYWAPMGNPGFFKWSGVAWVGLSNAELTQLIGNHVFLNQELSTAAMVNGFYRAQNSSWIVIENNKFHGAERDSLATITDPNKQKSNGYFHGIDKVIYNPQLSIYNTIASASISVTPQVNPQYLKFKELVSLAGLASKDFGGTTAIDINKKYTLFAPSNDAIIAAQIAGKLPKTGAQGSQTLTAAEKARLANWVKFFLVPEQEIFTDGKVTGVFPTSKPDPAYTPSNPVFIPVTITYPGSILTVKDNLGKTAKVDMTKPSVYPQNTIA
ncbi:MAG TPA: fasciclin domain-containing protein, partial [Chitinophagaceae bacterium]|nr:fasciclin domain-containing protein [Chitinophagaceae bacterium]